MENSRDERAFNRLAGCTALVSAAAWITWAILNSVTHGGLDSGRGIDARVFKLAGVLTAGWNLLLIPAAFALWKLLEQRNPARVLLYTMSGIGALFFWAYGGATHGITASLETTYLLMGGIWWVGIGQELRQERRVFGTYTVLLGLMTCLDGVFTILEPLPDLIYMIAAPKLPMALVWSLWVGILLLRRGTGNRETLHASAPQDGTVNAIS